MRMVAVLSVAVLITSVGIAAQDARVERGEKLYADNKCAMCHSIAGKGNAKGPLDSVGANRTPEVIRQWLINPAEMAGKTEATRKPPMPNYAKLSKEDLDALVSYLGTLKKK